MISRPGGSAKRTVLLLVVIGSFVLANCEDYYYYYYENYDDYDESGSLYDYAEDFVESVAEGFDAVVDGVSDFFGNLFSGDAAEDIRELSDDAVIVTNEVVDYVSSGEFSEDVVDTANQVGELVEDVTNEVVDYVGSGEFSEDVVDTANQVGQLVQDVGDAVKDGSRTVSDKTYQTSSGDTILVCTLAVFTFTFLYLP